MSAQRHLTDCTTEAHRLVLELQSTIDAARSGHSATLSELEHFRHAAIAVLYHAGRAGVDLARMPEQERRVPTLVVSAPAGRVQ